LELTRIYPLALGILLSACAATSEPPIVKTDVVRVYPELPDIEPLPPLTLIPFEWDYPRDKTKRIPKSTNECLKIPEQQRDNSYWDRCGENPPLSDSNIFMGLSRDDFETFLINNEKIKARLLQYKARIDEINQQREMWRKKNLEAQQKMLPDSPKKH